MMVYEKETNAIKVSVSPVYLEDESDPIDHHYVWAYHVRIENTGKETVQLMSRTWNITDGQGRMREIKGAGVVGEQPVLKPGDSFEYTRWHASHHRLWIHGRLLSHGDKKGQTP